VSQDGEMLIPRQEEYLEEHLVEDKITLLPVHMDKEDDLLQI
jgi:hypothetical protein